MHGGGRWARLAAMMLSLSAAACRQALERTFSFSSDAPVRSGIVPTGSGLSFGTEGGEVLMLTAEGQKRWSVRLGREVAGRPVVVGDTVVAASVSGEWAGIAADSGEVRWRLADQVGTYTDLATDGERVFLVGPDGGLRAIDPASGALLWLRPPPSGAAAEEHPFAAPHVVGGMLMTGLRAHGVLAVRAKDGELAWRTQVPAVEIAADPEPSQPTRSSPLRCGCVFVAASPDKVIALRATDGKVQWTQTLGRLSGALSLVEGNVWVGLAGGTLVQLRGTDGVELWRVRLPEPTTAGVTLFGELVVVATAGAEGHLVGLSPPAKKPLFDVRIDTAVLSRPRIVGDRLVVLGRDGRVLGFRMRRR